MNMFQETVGYRDFHSDTNFNFQLNRWLPYLPEGEVQRAAAEITGFDNWKQVMWSYGDRAEVDGRLSHAAFYYRAAEFFIESGDPDKEIAYDKFISLFRQASTDLTYDRVKVPYQDQYLPAFVIAAEGTELDTLVVHGGFDSLAEELLYQFPAMAAAGVRVILFEGPGQGFPLKKLGLPMIPEWEQPVGAVLDHFDIAECTLLGISLGGGLAIRAAAFEPRIKRVIADDVLDDFFGVLVSRMPAMKSRIITTLLDRNLQALVNRAFTRAAKSDRVIAWAIDHGMNVSGTSTPFDYLKWTQRINTREVSAQVQQDCLLLAARDDHLVPLSQYFRQSQNLVAARSVTGRVFSANEHAGNHCHVGNFGLANQFIADWLLNLVCPENASRSKESDARLR